MKNHILKYSYFERPLLILLFITTCINTPNQNRISYLSEKYNPSYLKAKSFFKSKDVEYFPEQLDTNFIYFNDYLSPELGEIGLYLTCKLPNENLITSIANKAIAAYCPTDSCLLIVNRFATKDDFYNVEISKKMKAIIDLNCYKNHFPIPNFYDNKFATNQTACKLSKDFIIYVLFSRPGKFLKDDLLTNGKFMPQNWKNGISKGISVNKKDHIIVYWLTIW